MAPIFAVVHNAAYPKKAETPIYLAPQQVSRQNAAKSGAPARRLFAAMQTVAREHRRTMSPLTLALYQPDIPQNAGTMLRLCACLGVDAAIIGPAGFPTSDRHFRRAGMDYLDHVTATRHISFAAFEDWRAAQRDLPGDSRGARLVLLSRHATLSYLDCAYRPGDILLVGRESAGVAEEVSRAADVSVTIPMQGAMRSLNVAMAAAMVVGEALRQLRAP